jgi:hypothetical protein
MNTSWTRRKSWICATDENHPDIPGGRLKESHPVEAIDEDAEDAQRHQQVEHLWCKHV